MPRLHIDIKYQDLHKLHQKRDQAMAQGLLQSSGDDFVPAEIRIGDRTVRVKLRLKGDYTDHLEGEKWSMRIHVDWLDANPQPVLINRYQRRYFVSRDCRVRLTVEWNQRVYDQRLYSKPNLTRTANVPDTLVVEIKFDREDRKLANRYAQGIPIRLSRNSKYVIGVDSITYD